MGRSIFLILLFSILLPISSWAKGVCPEIAARGISTIDEAEICAQDWLDRWNLKDVGYLKVLGVLRPDTMRFSGAFGKEKNFVKIMGEMTYYLLRYRSWNLQVIRALPLGENGFAIEYRGTATELSGKVIKAWGSDWITIDGEGKFLTWAGYYNDENSVPKD